MWSVFQLVESMIVVHVVAGSNPVRPPKNYILTVIIQNSILSVIMKFELKSTLYKYI